MTRGIELGSMQLNLGGSSFSHAELVETFWKVASSEKALRCVRGKTAGPLGKLGTFQWTKAVRAASSMLLLHKLRSVSPNNTTNATNYLLVGEGASLASSLDYALSKQPQWVLDMFGISLSGLPIAYRIFSRINSSRKRVGPVIIGINDNFLSPKSIAITFNGRPVSAFDDLQQIITGWMRDEPKDRVGSVNQLEFYDHSTNSSIVGV